MEFPSETPSSPQASDQTPVIPTQKEGPWKLIVFCAVFVLIFMLFAFFPPAKQLMVQMEVFFQNNGTYGSLCLIFFVGCLVVPLGLPYSMFEMLFAVMFDSFWYATALTTIAQTLGSVISYILTKHILKQRLRVLLRSHTIYQGIEAVLMKDPVKFSLILRLTNLPLLLKNYGLAIPDNIDFKVYILTSIVGTLFVSAPQIYIFQEAQEISELMDRRDNPLKTFFTFLTLILSVAVILYIIWYTKKMLNTIKKEIKSLKPIVLQEIIIQPKVSLESGSSAASSENKFEEAKPFNIPQTAKAVDDIKIQFISDRKLEGMRLLTHNLKNPEEQKINFVGHLINAV